MRMTTKRALLGALVLGLMLLATGCRTRTTGIPDSGAASERTEQAGSADEALSGPENLDQDAADSGEAADEADDGAPGGATRENPDASRREYDENAAAEIVPGTDRAVHGAGEGPGTPVRNDEADARAAILDDAAAETATMTVPADEAEQLGVDPDAKEADSAMTYYSALLSERTGSLFECQRLTVYWETAEDHVTVFKTSPEHQLILGAGAYDVSARLLQENLRVDDGWVARKNPGVIVKILPGGPTDDAAAARSLCDELTRREGWAEIDAVRNGRVVILSGDVLKAPHLQLFGMLVIAKTANASLYDDVDLDEALAALSQEGAGSTPAGIYYYTGGTP